MNRTVFRLLLVCALAVPAALVNQPLNAETNAQGEVFLKGNYIEAGLHGAGSFGTAGNAPAGFVSAGQRLGFIADYGRDGWTVGTPPYSGDYFVPGSPVESWTIQYRLGATTTRRTNAGLMGFNQVIGTLTETSTADAQSAVWEVTSGTLRIRKTMSFGNDDRHIRIDTVITNQGTVAVDGLEFMRNVDPDPEQPWTGNFNTENYAVETGHRKMVVGRGRTYRNLTLGLATVDPRAAVAIFGFHNTDPAQVWIEAANNHLYSESHPDYADEALNLAYRLGRLEPGQSVSFQYAYVFSAADFTQVFDSLTPSVAVVSPGVGPINGTVALRARAVDPASIAKVDFYVNDQFIGSDTTADLGVFEVPFNTAAWPNGGITVTAIATFADGRTTVHSSNSRIDHAAIPESPIKLVFTSPSPGQTFAVDGTYTASLGQVAGPPITSVRFFRESSSSGSLLLDEDTVEPFEVSFDVAGLPAGEIVSIKAVATDGWDQAVAYVTGRLPSAPLGDTFLKGSYIEAGVHRAGSFGTAGNAPSSYVYRNQLLGFIADYGRDGWTTGLPPFAGDYFVPGQPVEGWTVEWTGASGTERSFTNQGLLGEEGVRPTRITNTSTADTQSVVWEGLASGASGEQLKVTQTVSFRNDGLYMTVRHVLTNVGSQPLGAVDFMRNVDPDQEQPWTGNFSTRNHAIEEGNRKLVIAKGNAYRQLTLGLGTIDARARVTFGGFDNTDPDWVWTRADAINHLYSATSPRYADEAIALAFRLGTLAPGQSASFDYAYILNEADLDESLADLVAVTIVQPTTTASGATVPFQVTTDDVDGTTNVQFYVNGVLVGEDASRDAAGLFETAFDSRAYPNGTIELKAVATFASGRVAERSAIVTVDNPGPPVGFVTPAPGDTFLAGAPLTASVNSTDSEHVAVRVRFFRESPSSGSVLLGEDTAAPFSVPFTVDGLLEGETVIIRAIAFDDLGRSTTILVSGTVLIVQPQEITFGGLTDRTYGDADVTLSASATSELPVSFSVAGNCTIADAVVSITGAGSCTVMASQTGNEGWHPAPDVTQTFSIAPATLTVTAPSATRVYGEPNGVLTATYAGFVRGDTAAVLAGAPAISTTAVATSPVGSYPVTAAAGTLTAANYTFAFQPGALTVTSRAVTVAAATQTKAYGDADPALTYTVAAGTLAAGDGFTGALARAAGEGVGTYAIEQGTLALNGNYVVTFVPANLTITPRVVIVTATALTKVYGDADPALGYEVTEGSLAGEDAFAGALDRTPGEDVGTYAIGQGTLALDGNYAFTFVPASLTITPRALTVTAHPQAKVYGEADPALTYVVTAGSLAAGDGITGALARQPGEDAGSYPILQGTLSAGANYALTFAPALFTISKATPVVLVIGGSVPFDDAPHGATCAVTGPTGLLPGIISYTPGPGVPVSMGTYTATCAFAGDANHLPAMGTATITITLPICQVDDGAGVLVRRGVTFNGGSSVQGSVQVLDASNVTLNGSATIAGDLIVPGTPTVQVNGRPTFGGTVDAAGSATPAGHRVTINGGASLGRLVQRARAKTLPEVAAPPAPAGARTVVLNRRTDRVDSFETLRNLTLNASVGAVEIPAGTYGSFTANGNSAFVLGVAGSTTPAVYNFQSLRLNGNSWLEVAGPVIVTIADAVVFNGSAGNAEHPEWLTLRVAEGGVTLNGSVTVAGFIEAPNGAVTINGGSRLTGAIAADRLTLNGNARLVLTPPPTCQ